MSQAAMNIAAITGPITKPCSRRAGLNLWVLPGFRIVLDDVIYGTVEDHKPRGITGYNLGQNPRGRRYLLISALVGYQAVENLLPDGLFMLGRDAFVAPFLNG